MFAKFAGSLLVLGSIFGAALVASPKADDCCTQKLACCNQAGACCTSAQQLGCCQQGQQCCAENRNCCAGVPACCLTGSACCDEGKACCGPTNNPNQISQAIREAKPSTCCSVEKTGQK